MMPGPHKVLVVNAINL